MRIVSHDSRYSGDSVRPNRIWIQESLRLEQADIDLFSGVDRMAVGAVTPPAEEDGRIVGHACMGQRRDAAGEPSS